MAVPPDVPMIRMSSPWLAVSNGRLSLRKRLEQMPFLRVVVAPGFGSLAMGTILVAALAVRVFQISQAVETPFWGVDFAAYSQAASALVADHSPYTADQLAGPYMPTVSGLYLYPPLLSALVMPMTALPGPVARGAWSLLGAIAFVAVGVLVAQTEGLGQSRRSLGLLVLAGLVFPPVYIDEVLGNLNLWLFALLGLAWLGHRSDRPVVLGVAIAAATLLKVFPVLLLVWLIGRREWRALGWSAIGAAAMVAIALPVTGIQPWLDYPRVILNAAAGVVAAVPTIGDLLTTMIGTGAARLVVLMGGIVVVYGTARRWPANLSYGMAIAVAVLTVPILWNHYLVLMLLPLLLVAAHARPRWLPAVPYLLLWPTGLGPILMIGSWLVPGVLVATARRHGVRGSDGVTSDGSLRSLSNARGSTAR
jgi:Glycosyltransferase family 87